MSLQRRQGGLDAVGEPAQAIDGGVVETSIPYRLDALYWSGFHTRVVLALGITWVLDGLEVTLAGTLSGALKQSPVLQRWWSSGKQDKTAELDALVNKVHDLSQYLGDEMVIVALKQQNGSGFAVIADVQRSGLAGMAWINTIASQSASRVGWPPRREPLDGVHRDLGLLEWQP